MKCSMFVWACMMFPSGADMSFMHMGVGEWIPGKPTPERRHGESQFRIFKIAWLNILLLYEDVVLTSHLEPPSKLNGSGQLRMMRAGADHYWSRSCFICRSAATPSARLKSRFQTSRFFWLGFHASRHHILSSFFSSDSIVQNKGGCTCHEWSCWSHRRSRHL